MTVKEGYETFTLVWCEREVEVSVQANWLNTGHWHIELRCVERLPVTETGYRSHFAPEGVPSAQDDVRMYVLEWLDTSAQDPSWQRYVEDSKQLKLF